MFYKKRIEELERKLELLTKELEENEAIGEVHSHFIGYACNSNKSLGWQVKDNNRMLEDIFDYLDVYYFHVLEPQKKRLVKRKKKKNK